MQQHWEIIEQLTEATWGRGWIVFVGVQNDGTFNSFHEEETGELLAKSKQEQQQFDGQHLLIGEYIFVV